MDSRNYWAVPFQIIQTSNLTLWNDRVFDCIKTELEKAVSRASNACEHFVRNIAILSTFWVKYPVLLTEDGGRRVEDGELRLDNGHFS